METSKSAVSSRTADPQLIALLRYILGDGGDGDYLDIITRNATVAANDIVRDIKPSMVFNDGAGGPSTYDAILQGVEQWLEHPDPAMPEKRLTLSALRALHQEADDAPTLTAEQLCGAIRPFADSGMFFGAALMYELLRGRTAEAAPLRA